LAHLGMVLQTGPYTYENADTVVKLADTALAEGHEVSIFLYIDGVIAANKNIDTPDERNLNQLLQALADKGAAIAACGACSKFRGITDEAFADDIEMGSIVDFADMLMEVDAVINFAM